MSANGAGLPQRFLKFIMNFITAPHAVCPTSVLILSWWFQGMIIILEPRTGTLNKSMPVIAQKNVAHVVSHYAHKDVSAFLLLHGSLWCALLLWNRRVRGPTQRSGGRQHANLARNHLDVTQTCIWGGKWAKPACFCGRKYGEIWRNQTINLNLGSKIATWRVCFDSSTNDGASDRPEAVALQAFLPEAPRSTCSTFKATKPQT